MAEIRYRFTDGRRNEPTEADAKLRDFERRRTNLLYEIDMRMNETEGYRREEINQDGYAVFIFPDDAKTLFATVIDQAVRQHDVGLE